jgi:hypothetical protein
VAEQWAVFVTWQELFDVSPVEQEVIDVVSTFNRESTIVLLSRLGTYLFVDQFRRITAETAALQDLLVQDLLDVDVQKRLRARVPGPNFSFRRCFHSQQVLTLLKWVVVHALLVGGEEPDRNPDALKLLGTCLLKTNDLLMSQGMSAQIAADRKKPRTAERYLRLQLAVGSGIEIFNPPPVPTSIVRSQTIFEDIATRGTTSANLSDLFAQQSGLHLDSYVDMIFGALAGYMSRRPQQLLDDPALTLFNPVTFFGNSISSEAAYQFWSMESHSIDELASSLSMPSALVSHKDFTAFRMKPFIRLSSGSVISPHPGFVQEKLEIGLFWTIVNSLQGDIRQKAFDTWGNLFEIYVNELLSDTARASREQYFAFPEYKAKKHHHESFDSILISGKVCVAIECKGGFLPNSAKYADDLEKYRSSLDKKFGTEKGAGVEQLARKIGHVFAAKKEDERELEGIDLSQVKIVVPVLVVQDNFASSRLTTPWLAKAFRDLMRKQSLSRRIVVVSLLVLHVEDIESLQTYMQSGNFRLGDCFLFAGKRGDPGLFQPVFQFSDIFEDFLKENGIGAISHRQNTRFSEIVNRITLRFFGQTLEPETESDGAA